MKNRRNTNRRNDFSRTIVQLFGNYRATIGERVELQEFIDMIKRPNKLIEQLRAEADPDKQKAIKAKLPAVAISAVYSEGATSRAHEYIEAPTGLICVDVDAKDNPGISTEDMKKWLSECAQTLYCAVSARGKGVFAIMRLMYPHAFKGQFRALQRMIKLHLGLTIDGSCSDPTRLRLLSHDDSPYINYDAEPFALVDPRDLRASSPASSIDIETPNDITAKVKIYADEVISRHVDICPTYEEWRNVGFALHTMGESGKPIFRALSNQWSRGTPANDAELERLWQSAKNDNREGAITIATFFNQCHRYDVRPYFNPNPASVFDGLELEDL